MSELRKIVDGGQMCGKCGSPLVPCKCNRQDGRVSRFGSTLKANPKKMLKTRSLKEKFKDEPTRYGQVFEEARLLLCFGLGRLPGHVCGIGVARSTAHHIGKDDLEGLLPSCGKLHDDLHERAGEVSKALRRAGSPPLHVLAGRYVEDILARLEDRGELEPEVEAAARARGIVWRKEGGLEE